MWSWYLPERINIGLIFCRGGSKGIPGKNIKNFHGRPLLEWVVEAAKNSKLFDSIYLSTDDPNIAALGRKIGLEVPFLRPASLATDTSDQFKSHDHIIKKLKLNDFEHRICVINNNPFIGQQMFKASFREFMANDETRIVVDAIRINSDEHYYRQMIRNGSILEIKFKDDYMSSNINRQADKDLYAPINNIRWGLPSWMQSYTAYKKKVSEVGHGFIILPKIRNFDLDDMYDWTIAEKVFLLND